jgi:hypothetical protein
MDDEMEPSAWRQTTGNVGPLRASAVPGMRCNGLPPALSTSLAASTDRDRPDFAAIIGPCLALAAPAGMTEDERFAWVEAAFTALRHLPLDVIADGAKDALRTADHPSKIVPAIIAATEGQMAWRRRMNTPFAPSAQALPAPGKERATSSELDAICKKFAVGRYAREQFAADPSRPAHLGKNPDRECRTPTREDYIRLFGVDPDAPSAA